MSTADNFISTDSYSPQKSNKVALVVGVNNSTSISTYFSSLLFAEKDAEDIAYLFKQPECNFTLLPLLIREKATTWNIKQHIIELASNRSEDDFLLFYYAGHALPLKDDIYFVTYDFRPEHVELDSNLYLSMRWLWKVLYQASQAGRVLLILDCCYSGNMVDVKDDPLNIDLRQLFASWELTSNNKDLKNCLRLILTSTGYDIPAREADGHGLMTGLLIKALRGAKEALDNEGNVDIKALHAYLHKNMPQEQLPDLAGKFGPYNCILATYPKFSYSNIERDKHSEIVTAISNLITDPEFFKRLTYTNTNYHVQELDLLICEKASYVDLNEKKVGEFYKRDRVQIQDDFYNEAPNQENLGHFGLLQESNPTYGALLCFGINPTKWLPGAFTRCTLWSGNDRDLGWMEAQDHRRDLLTQFELSRNFLRKHLPLVRVIIGDERAEELDVPMVALEEALANALVHREYAKQTSPVYVDIFNNRIEISSPGTPPEPMTIEILEQEHKSHPRNPQIARIFYLFGYVEKVGSGIRRMQRAMEKAGLPPAEFRIGTDRTFTVIFYRTGSEELAPAAESEISSSFEHASNEDALSPFRQLPIPAQYSQKNFPNTTRANTEIFSERIQKYLRTSGYTQKELADALGMHPKVLSRKLHNNGNTWLTYLEIQHIITTLASWRAITTREEVFQLLEATEIDPRILSADQWEIPPLNALTHESRHLLAISQPALLPQHNLPTPATPLVGREWAVTHLQQLIGRKETRLITLVGPGGSGKTRLALHVARELINTFAQGVWLVPLAGISDPDLVPMSIIQALNIQSTPDITPLQSLITYLRPKRLLLVLDNFEQVSEARTAVDELLAAAPGLKIIATSRAVLRLYGEREFRVPPLDVPDLALPLTAAKLAQYGAVQLFVERAQAAMPDFVLGNENAAMIAQICVRVDGLPLALELAAARLKTLSPALLLERLSQARLPLLTGGARNLPGRQQTLRGTIDWSYGLLSPVERVWFRRLAIFSGSWSLEAVEAMIYGIDEDAEQSSDPGFPLDLLEQLADNSLLQRLPTTGGQVRFTMLGTLREYALEQLTTQEDLKLLRDWHACYYLREAETAELHLRGPQQLTWLARLMADRDNFRAALEWSLHKARNGQRIDVLRWASEKWEVAGSRILSGREQSVDRLSAIELCLSLTAALRPYWEWQGHLIEGRYWLGNILEVPLEKIEGKTVLAAQARALSEYARLVFLQNDQTRAAKLAEASITLWRQLNDPAGLGIALLHRGWAAYGEGEYEIAKRVYQEGLDLLSPAENPWLYAQLLSHLAAVAGFTSDYEQMQALYTESRKLFEQVGDKCAIADLLKDQGGMLTLEGDYAEAIDYLVQSLKLCYELGHQQFIATGLGLLSFAVGLLELPDPTTASIYSAQLSASSDALMDTIGLTPWTRTNPMIQMLRQDIRSRVDNETWEAAWAAGQALTLEEAIELAIRVGN